MNDIHRPHRKVPAGRKPVEVRKGEAVLHREPQADVVMMARVGATIPVLQEVVGAYPIGIRAIGGCGNRKWRLHEGWLEYPLWANHRHAPLSKLKTLGKHSSRHHTIWVYGDLASEPVEGCSPDSRIVVPVEVHDAVSSSKTRSLRQYTAASVPAP